MKTLSSGKMVPVEQKMGQLEKYPLLANTPPFYETPIGTLKFPWDIMIRNSINLAVKQTFCRKFEIKLFTHSGGYFWFSNLLWRLGLILMRCAWRPVPKSPYPSVGAGLGALQPVAVRTRPALKARIAQ